MWDWLAQACGFDADKRSCCIHQSLWMCSWFHRVAEQQPTPWVHAGAAYHQDQGGHAGTTFNIFFIKSSKKDGETHTECGGHINTVQFRVWCANFAALILLRLSCCSYLAVSCCSYVAAPKSCARLCPKHVSDISAPARVLGLTSCAYVAPSMTWA